jgi:predicted dithiol-disulfide oxidoreductase (DUF899 family)
LIHIIKIALQLLHIFKIALQLPPNRRRKDQLYTMTTLATEIVLWPGNASEEYINARRELQKAEHALSDQIETIAQLRRGLPIGAPMPTYTFTEAAATAANAAASKQTSLADLGSDGRSVVIYHMMFADSDDAPCPMCAMWIDGFNGVAPHLAQNVNFAAVAKAPLPQLVEYARRRGWHKVRLLSSAGTDFNKDMSVEDVPWLPGSGQMPGVSVFKKDGEGVMRHVYTVSPHFTKDVVRGADQLTPLWNVLDLIPEGRGEFMASNKYINLANAK